MLPVRVIEHTYAIDSRETFGIGALARTHSGAKKQDAQLGKESWKARAEHESCIRHELNGGAISQGDHAQGGGGRATV